MRSISRAAFVVALASCVSIVGCGDLSNMLYGDHTGVSRRPQPPAVRLVETRLVHAPTNRQLALHFCREHATRRGGRAAALACRAFGELPSREDLRFTFEVELEAQNTGRVPLPVVEALLALSVFPDTDAQHLGTVCVRMCRGTEQCPQDLENACESEEPEIRDLRSFAGAAAGFLTSVAVGERRFSDLQVRTIDPNETLRLVASFTLDVEPALAVIEWAAQEAVASASRGEMPSFTIDYELEGTLFCEVPDFGRFAGSFPPVRGSWPLESE
ncbi:MAG: hypothetical protein J0L92_18700 [Deltaproteobacteria bacterium]|nr:hypothetical protein [Deltaproteobacteria bacterium]